MQARAADLANAIFQREVSFGKGEISAKIILKNNLADPGI